LWFGRTGNPYSSYTLALAGELPKIRQNAHAAPLETWVIWVMTLRQIDTRTAPEAELRLISQFWNEQRLEIFPEDPPTPLEERLKWWREPPSYVETRLFVLFDGNKVIGTANSDWRTNDSENPDTGWIEVNVAPEYHRRGIGSKLMLALLEEIVQHGRKKMFAVSTSKRVGGKPFLEMLGAKFGQEEHTNQLLFADLNHEYIKKSLENAPTDVYELVWYEDNLPQDMGELQRLCVAFNIMNTAPRGELEINDWKATPEKLVQEYAQASKNDTRWILCLAKHKKTGVYVGFTETGWHPNRPKIGEQWGTGVDPAHRGQGLGAWLKSAMLERIFRQRPTVDRIRTGNADSNAPMLKINHTLGFKPFLDRIEWQIDVQKSLKILQTPKETQ
jgi:mycothiol synthase